jgi:hypothetical protein
MYGLVNQAVEDMAVHLGGPELWASIYERVGLDLPEFVAMQSYDDDITYRLVGAASEVLELTPSEVLEAFGEHWIRYTGEQGYGPMLAAMGRTLPQFLGNLDSMHSRIALNMPELRPPVFACEELGEGRLVVRYWSERSGLAPMVTGLLKGLAGRFALEMTVTCADPRPVGEDHDTFTVTYAPSGTPLARFCGDSAEVNPRGAVTPVPGR